MRVFALSDIHVDHPDNLIWIEALSTQDYRHDVLLLAGDVTHQLDKLAHTLALLQERFARVFFVPGNHDLWVTASEQGDSLDKLDRVQELCRSSGVFTQPARLSLAGKAVWIVPLLSWYAKPEDNDDSLFMNKKGEDPQLLVWSDNYLIKWPQRVDQPDAWFAQMNGQALATTYDAPVISFSHFLPRIDLIFSSEAENQTYGGSIPDVLKSFNFSRVAGTKKLERQIRKLGSVVHVYGHQHRNRFRVEDGVTYVSACLGYGVEREAGRIRYLESGPIQVWDVGSGSIPSPPAGP